MVGIVVVCQTTSERKKETEELFDEIRPFLDKGYSFNSALKKIGKLSQKKCGNNTAWYRELRQYSEERGYPFVEYSGKGFKK